MTHGITFQDSGETRWIDGGKPLSEALRGAGRVFAMPCGGQGTCGKCAVWVSGPASPMDEAEQTLLNRLPPFPSPAPGYFLRLACACHAEGNCTVLLPEASANMVILAQGDGDLPRYDGPAHDALGFAVDVGTTTIAVALYDLREGKRLAVRTAVNEQSAYGADVLSRIAYGDVHGTDELHRTIVRQLNALMEEALKNGFAQAARVSRAAITGNTTMLHLLAGYNPHGIGIAPFTPESLFGEEFPARTLFPMLSESVPLYLPSCVSAYIGADLVCGMMALGMDWTRGSCLLIDVGTNGEMALAHKGEILCCATAAGPAFEGARIAMGMGAASGAICSVNPAKEGLSTATIGNAPAQGICGTGLIGAIGTLRKLGIIDESGTLLAQGHPWESLMLVHEGTPAIRLGDTSVILTARDIREVQLAKAAIAAGIETLLAEAGLAPQAVDEVFLAGGFGSAIDPKEAADIGLIPPALAPKAKAAGNAALSGAAMMLMSKERREAGAKIAARARELPLATDPRFMDGFMEHMMFPEG